MSFLASNIRFLRKRLNLSQTAFADRVEMNRGNIASYEKGSAEPNTVKLLRISRFFGVSLHDLLENDLAASWGTNISPEGSPPRLPSTSEAIDAIREINQLKKVFNGLKELHNFSTNDASTLSTQQISADYERLLSLTDKLFNLNQRLFSIEEME